MYVWRYLGLLQSAERAARAAAGESRPRRIRSSWTTTPWLLGCLICRLSDLRFVWFAVCLICRLSDLPFVWCFIVSLFDLEHFYTAWLSSCVIVMQPLLYFLIIILCDFHAIVHDNHALLLPDFLVFVFSTVSLFHLIISPFSQPNIYILFCHFVWFPCGCP